MHRSYLVLIVALIVWIVATVQLISISTIPLISVTFASPVAVIWLLTAIIIIASWIWKLTQNLTQKWVNQSIQLMDLPLIITDTNGNIIWRNDYAKRLLHDSPELLEQLKEVFDTVAEESNQRIRQVVRSSNHQFRIQIKSIERSRFLLSLEVIEESPNTNEFYDLFIRRIVHDMRNPLAAIIGHAANLRYANPDTADTWQKSANTIESEAQRLSRLVDSMLFDARLAYVPLQLDVIDVADIVEESLYVMEDSAIREGKTIQINLPPDELPIKVDRDLMVRAFENLIDNAVKYTPDNGRINIRVTMANNQIRIMFKDNGEGIPAEYLPEKIFEPLVRATSQKGGSGLGLSTVKKIIEMHRGRITVKSKVSEGTLMTVILPLYEESHHAH